MNFLKGRPLFAIFILLAVAGCQARPLYKDTQVLMGTFVEVTSPDRRASAIVFDEIKRLESLLSKYREESETAKLNKFGKIKASPETFYAVKKAKEIYEITAGVFDVTVGPLVDLWGFTDKDYRVPDDAEIKGALKRVGSDKIILDEAQSVIQFAVSGMRIDLGAIAKGYILDCAVKKLKENGITSCLINAGGQVIALGGKPPDGRPWKVAIRKARKNEFSGSVDLKDNSVSTSGDYEQYFIKGGSRYAHIINPKTGYPVNSGILSVTVIAPSGLDADALSTSIFLLGRQKGEELAERYFPGVQVMAVEQENVPDNK